VSPPAAERWAHLARLVTLHDQACEALGLLRGQLPRGGGSALREVAARHRRLAWQLDELARTGPADLRAAARAHAEAAERALG
jgi:hypothetical protein